MQSSPSLLILGIHISATDEKNPSNFLVSAKGRVVQRSPAPHALDVHVCIMLEKNPNDVHISPP